MAAKKASIEVKERVSVALPRARHGEEENLFVGVNGVNYIVPKGRSVDVPDFVAEEIRRAQEAEDRMYAEKERLLEQARN